MTLSPEEWIIDFEYATFQKKNRDKSSFSSEGSPEKVPAYLRFHLCSLFPQIVRLEIPISTLAEIGSFISYRVPGGSLPDRFFYFQVNGISTRGKWPEGSLALCRA